MSRLTSSLPLSHRKTDSAERDCLYAQAFEPFKADKGTVYRTTQATLDSHQQSMFASRKGRHFVSAKQVTADMMHQNDIHRKVSQREHNAYERLIRAVYDYEGGYRYGPDLAIKAFNDLDIVFFGGYLRGNVCVVWSSSRWDRRCRSHDGTRPIWGLTSTTGCAIGQCLIVLNADLIFSHTSRPDPFEGMMSTLLHEMCHAIENVRCPQAIPSGGDGMGHDMHFETRISVVHKRAMRMYGLRAISKFEPYRQRHWFVDARGAGGHHSCVRHDHRDARHGRHIDHRPTPAHGTFILKDGSGKHSQVRTKRGESGAGCIVM